MTRKKKHQNRKSRKRSRKPNTIEKTNSVLTRTEKKFSDTILENPSKEKSLKEIIVQTVIVIIVFCCMIKISNYYSLELQTMINNSGIQQDSIDAQGILQITMVLKSNFGDILKMIAKEFLSNISIVSVGGLIIYGIVEKTQKVDKYFEIIDDVCNWGYGALSLLAYCGVAFCYNGT